MGSGITPSRQDNNLNSLFWNGSIVHSGPDVDRFRDVDREPSPDVNAILSESYEKLLMSLPEIDVLIVLIRLQEQST